VDGPYYWLLNKLGLYKPVTWEYSRCNITHNVLSKRKLHALVVRNQVRHAPPSAKARWPRIVSECEMRDALDCCTLDARVGVT